MKNHFRNYNLVNNKKDLEHLYSFKNFPIFMGSTKNHYSQDIKKDMHWFISKSSGMIQLNPLIPEKILYSRSHNSGVVGKMWMEHHQKFANFINKSGVLNVLEIGAGHGILSQKVLSKKKINWTIVEVNSIKKFKNVKYIDGFFNKKILKNYKFDAIVMSHFLEHVYDINSLMNEFKEIKEDVKIFVSIPNLQEMLKRKYTNALNFEHTYYLNDKFFNILMQKHGFKIQKKLKFKSDHSIFYFLRRDIKNTKTKFKNYYIQNKKLFKNYTNSFKKIVLNINKKIKFKKNIYLFGGHVFSQYMLNLGLNDVNIKCILDNDIKKHNKRLYGTKLIIKSPKIIKNNIQPVIILRAGVYNKEIKKQLLSLNSSCKIV